MKTKSLLLVAAFVVVGIVSARANNPVTTGLFVLPGNSGMYKLIYEGEKEASITLSILDSKGTIVFEERLSKMKGFIRPVNLRGMRADTYTFQVKQADKLFKEAVSYSPLAGKVSSRNLNDNRFAIGVTNLGLDTIEVKIYDADGGLVKAHQETVNGRFGKIFNLGNFQSASFTFEIYTNAGLLDKITF